MKVIISIPAFNEEKTLGKVIAEIREAFNGTHYDYKILVVNDGSKDKTLEVAKKAGAIVFSHTRNRGLAQTFKTEIEQFLKLKSDVFVHTDADGQYLGKDIPRLLAKIEHGYDLILGSRFRGKIEKMPFMKRFGNIAFSKVISMLTKTRITDSTTGFRAFTSEVASEIKIINNFTYTQEQILKAARQKFRIAEIPIYARKTRESRLFKSPLEYAIRAWINILRIYRDYDPIKFFGKVGLAFMIPGLLLGVYFTQMHFTTGIDGHVALLILIGIQTILFGFLADMRR